MKAKVLAALAATMAVSATYAFAANPFVDVPTDSWAYKSVVELADAGIVQGVDGKYFEGNRNITRYEAAEMVAKAMAHMDRATVEQRALINKLADEYADELNNLGVRVSNLENKVGNIKFTGDARLRYMHQTPYTYDGEKLPGKKNDNAWDYRIRLRGTAQVNDRVTATVGLSTNNRNFGSNGSALSLIHISFSAADSSEKGSFMRIFFSQPYSITALCHYVSISRSYRRLFSKNSSTVEKPNSFSSSMT